MQRSTKNKYTSLDLSMIKGWNKIPTKDNTQVSFLYECTASSPSSGRHILGSAFLVVALGLYRRCPFLGVFVINVKHLKGEWHRPRMPEETVTLICTFSFRYRILYNWKSQSQIYNPPLGSLQSFIYVPYILISFLVPSYIATYIFQLSQFLLSNIKFIFSWHTVCMITLKFP